MEITTLQRQYNLSREAASKLLKVSVRTLDRYLKAKKVSSRFVAGRIWLDREEIETFKLDKINAITVDRVDMSTSGMSIDNDMDKVDNNVDNVDNDVDKVDNIEVFEQDGVDTVSRKNSYGQSEGKVYQRLYNELKEELKEKQERLEIANYRVGQLEAQIRQSIPMLQYHKENFENKKAQQDLKGELLESANIIKTLNLKFKHNIFSKRIFLVLLLIILALQPLWLIFLLYPSS